MNKKIIKTLASITCGLGIASSIPFATTSCGNENVTGGKIIPDSVFRVSKTDPSMISGFVEGFNSLEWASKGYDTLRFPEKINNVEIIQLGDDSEYSEDFQNAMMTGIKTIIIPKNILALGLYVFSWCHSLENIIIYGNPEGNSPFVEDMALKSITYYDLQETPKIKNYSSSTHDTKLFTYAGQAYIPLYVDHIVSSKGNASYKSADLLEYFKNTSVSNLPDYWIAK